MVRESDFFSTIPLAPTDISAKQIPLKICTNSRSVFGYSTNINRMTKKRHLNDFCMLRENYERREITKILSVTTNRNSTDPLTKAAPCKELKLLKKTNKNFITPNA